MNTDVTADANSNVSAQDGIENINASSISPLEPKVVVDLLDEALEERGSPDRRQGILPDNKPAKERRSSVPRRSNDKA